MSKTKFVNLLTSDGSNFVTSDGKQLKVQVEQLIEAVDKVSEIPIDAKKAVKEFIAENSEELLGNIAEIGNMDVSPDILDMLPNLFEYLQLVIDMATSFVL